jgi:hypothetical protein
MIEKLSLRGGTTKQPRTIQGEYARRIPALGRGRAFTFVATKVTKKAFSREASLPHKAFTLQSRQNHGLLNLAATSFAQCHDFGKVC